MPPAEVEVSADLVFRLLTTQRPQLAGLEVESPAHGWDNVSFRLGEELVARFPRRQLAVELLANEARWLPDLARRLPLPIPAPGLHGEGGARLPVALGAGPLDPRPVGCGLHRLGPDDLCVISRGLSRCPPCQGTG
jgi:hypothetical protein